MTICVWDIYLKGGFFVGKQNLSISILLEVRTKRKTPVIKTENSTELVLNAC